MASTAPSRQPGAALDATEQSLFPSAMIIALVMMSDHATIYHLVNRQFHQNSFTSLLPYTLLTQDLAGRHESVSRPGKPLPAQCQTPTLNALGINSQATMPTPQPSHRIRLHARHAKQILRLGQIAGQLRQLRVQAILKSHTWHQLQTAQFSPGRV